MINITSTITNVELRIIDFLLDNVNETFAVRELARKTGMDYKLAHTGVQKLAKKGVLNKKRQANIDLCSLDLRGNLAPVYYAEMLRTQTFFKKHRELEPFFNNIGNKIKGLYYTLLIFGSYSKGKNRKTSDLDVLIIAPTNRIGDQIARSITAEATFIKTSVEVIVLDEQAFISSLTEKNANVATEALTNHIIITGIEAFYQGVRKAR